jgi:hypothetical protein
MLSSAGGGGVGTRMRWPNVSERQLVGGTVCVVALLLLLRGGASGVERVRVEVRPAEPDASPPRHLATAR